MKHQYVALDWNNGTIRFTTHNVSSLLDTFRTHVAWYDCRVTGWFVTIY